MKLSWQAGEQRSSKKSSDWTAEAVGSSRRCRRAVFLKISCDLLGDCNGLRLTLFNHWKFVVIWSALGINAVMLMVSFD